MGGKENHSYIQFLYGMAIEYSMEIEHFVHRDVLINA